MLGKFPVRFPLARHSGALLRLFTCLPACLLGDVIPVGDAGFEGNSLGPGGYHYDLGPEWEETGGSGNGSGFEEYIVGFSAEGTDHLGMGSGHDVWQDLGVSFLPDTRYTLTVAVGNRGATTQEGNQSTYVLADSGGGIHASGDFDASALDAGSFADAPVLVFDTSSSPSAVGLPVRVLLRARGNGRSHFDNIRLESTSLIVAGMATISLGPASGVHTSSAVLHATVTDGGDADPSVTFFYGTVDGGSNPAQWDYQVDLAGTHNGAVNTTVLGLDPATSYYFAARASNSVGYSWALPSGTFETLALPPVVENSPAGEVSGSTAVLGAVVSDSGGDNPAVMIYYGTQDGGADEENWAQSVSLGTISGSSEVTVSGLVPGSGYFFRAWAQNSGGSSWAASSASFNTPVISLPLVSNRTPNGITGTTASLRGEVEATGGDVPVVTVFYGPTDGGSDSGLWEHSVQLGSQDGGFSAFVNGLSANTEYWYRCRAVNALGGVWAGSSEIFATTELVPPGVVINEIHYDPTDESTPGEFVEIHNPGDQPVDLSGWRLTDGVSYTFPSGTSMDAGSYLVIAQDPATIMSIYGITAHGPWIGRLDNEGEQIDLRDEAGVVRDQVTYGVGFPWPTAARGGGASAELIHPSLDNELGGSWKSSPEVEPTSGTTLIPAADTAWHYRKGTSEASVPTGDWRMPVFPEDGTWLTGQAPIGYGDGDDNTLLNDMRYSYSSVYLRREFSLTPEAMPSALTLRVYVDDGAVVWLNGIEVARLHVPDGDLSYDAQSSDHEAGWEEIVIDQPEMILIGGTNVLAVHGLNTNLPSSDFSIDAELIAPGTAASAASPSPGERNRSHATSAAPQIRQVNHLPQTPSSGTPVTITAKITDPDGVGDVSLEYQIVEPGSFVRKSDAAYSAAWTSVAMSDDGRSGDLAGGDSVYTAVMPAGLQVHRRLIRYRINFEDGNGMAGIAPLPDDEQPNFAYFVYDGSPAWTGSFEPGGTASTFSPGLLDELPVYHLVSNETDVLNCQYSGSFDGVHMSGALVYDGVVYDHIEYENRGEASTYVSGKNKWRFHFNRARSFQPVDNWGRPYGSSLRKMNFDACASPWAALHRGMAGVEEALSYRLYELCGVASPRTHYVHFRVIDSATETNASEQYDGDLWGLYLVVEQPGGSYLSDRDLPDGNVYKIEGGNGDKKEQGLGQTADSSDWTAFWNSSASSQSEQWWRDNLDNPSYHSFRACNRISGNVDLREGYNHYYYHHPDGYWVPMPWDLDMMFIAETHWPGYLRAQNSLSHPALAMEYRNRARELLDLMCSDVSPTGGQIGQLIDEYAQLVNPAGQDLTWADLDANLWNYHPRTKGSPSTHSGQTNHKGNFFYTPFVDSRGGGSWTRTLVSSDHEGSMRYLRDYATDTFSGGTWSVGNGEQFGYGYEFLKKEAEDAEVPTQPMIGYGGSPGFPVNDLVFVSDVFSDPQGAGTFSSMRWRLAEVATPGKPGYMTGDPRKYEVETVWDSGEIPVFLASMQVPAVHARPGHTYRVRVRHKDSSGRWSHWSNPVEFEAGLPDVSVWRENLVVSEFMYNPPEPSTPEELSVSADSDAFEFIELKNVSETLTLDLSELRFTKGIDFDFAGSGVASLAPGELVLVVGNVAAFEARYGTGLPVAGAFLSGKLSNSGEELKLSFAAGVAIQQFTYDDQSPWPLEADGAGFPLVLVNPASKPDHDLAASWTAGSNSGGTPGVDEPALAGAYAEWLAGHFTPEQILDALLSDPGADPDGDGRSNFEERAFGTLPLLVDRPEVEFAWVTDGSDRFSGVRFHRPEGAIDLVYELLAGDDLEGWLLVPSTLHNEGVVELGIEQVVLKDLFGDQAPRRFLRVRVRSAP